MSRCALKTKIALAWCLFVMPATASAEAPLLNETVSSWLQDEMPALLENYRWLHTHPELSFREQQTAAFLAKSWRAAGLTVTEEVGGHGLVGLLENGQGPTLMLRCDLDALPVTEETSLPYASTLKATSAEGTETGVMHACGHDLHMTNLLATLQFLASHRELWTGTLMAVGQPAEERGSGAKAMLEDGLFTRFPKPDYAVALHCSSDKPTGQVGLHAGYAMANVDSVDIVVRGRGGHGSQPQNTIDPVVQAAFLVVSLQTIVSREISPLAPAVVTVGSIHGGTKHNIIGDRCTLQLTVRSYSDDVRKRLLTSIRRKAEAVAHEFDAPAPEITISEGTPSLKNDEALTMQLRRVFQKTLGVENVTNDDPWMAGEDFSRYGREGVPIVMYWLGTLSQERLAAYQAEGTTPPALHSAHFFPDAEEALQTGVLTMTAAALELLGR